MWRCGSSRAEAIGIGAPRGPDAFLASLSKPRPCRYNARKLSARSPGGWHGRHGQERLHESDPSA
ncbi:hypothetical protein HPA02_32160 [Bisbaumannia pacifica]|uniref:Uncharacterized protein n=1 Tax=Bisbaumannia pacifica TaxID=77098 RepID=A0A510XC19_9GAMM|nr:hypothetical protein HPA02_32160 [Halomonas pacifica]